MLVEDGSVVLDGRKDTTPGTRQVPDRRIQQERLTPRFYRPRLHLWLHWRRWLGLLDNRQAVMRSRMIREVRRSERMLGLWRAPHGRDLGQRRCGRMDVVNGRRDRMLLRLGRGDGVTRRRRCLGVRRQAGRQRRSAVLLVRIRLHLTLHLMRVGLWWGIGVLGMNWHRLGHRVGRHGRLLRVEDGGLGHVGVVVDLELLRRPLRSRVLLGPHVVGTHPAHAVPG